MGAGRAKEGGRWHGTVRDVVPLVYGGLDVNNEQL